MDDPVGAIAVHGVSGIWGVIAVGLFADNPVPLKTTRDRAGLFKGGGGYLFGVQCLSALTLTVWGVVATYGILWVINKFFPLRMNPHDELLGADLIEHNIRHGQIGISRAVSALGPQRVNVEHINSVPKIGSNPGHDNAIAELLLANNKFETVAETMMASIRPMKIGRRISVALGENSILNRIRNSISSIHNLEAGNLGSNIQFVSNPFGVINK